MKEFSDIDILIANKIKLTSKYTVCGEHKIIRNGTLYSGETPEQNVCYDESGNIVDASRLYRGDTPFEAPIKISISDKFKYTPRAVFINYHNQHWGHFLTETMARIYPLYFEDVSDTIVTQIPMHPRVSDLFNGPKLSNYKIVPLECNMRVGELLIPTPTMVLRSKISQDHIKTLNKFGSKYQRKTFNIKKCYLSRTKLLESVNTGWVKSRDVQNEKILEELLKFRGWEIIHPQELSASEQINVLENSKIVTGIYGSAFHTLMMCKKLPEKLIYLIGSPEDTTPNIAFQNTLLDYDSTYLSCIENNKFTDVNKILDFLEERAMKF